MLFVLTNGFWKVLRYLSCFSYRYCSSFLPSITDEVTINSIRFFVLELMELLFGEPISFLCSYFQYYIHKLMSQGLLNKLMSQGLLSTTYLVEIYFHTTSGGGEGVLEEEERKSGGGENVLEEEEKKSVFVKIPLTGDAGKNFKQVISQR